MSLQTNDIYEFEEFRLDLSEKTLQRGESPIPLTPKVFETLCVLIENAGHLVAKDVLMQKLWQDRFVEESNLTFNIKMLRKALGDNAQKPRFIETIQSRGYRFIAQVNAVQAPEPVALAEVPIAVRSEPKASVAGLDPSFEAAAVPMVARSRPAPRVVLFIIGFASAISLILLLSFNYRTVSSRQPSEAKSIAVLPLKPLTSENRDSSYELGVADSLILKLGSAKGLVVRSLAATRQYADIAQDALVAGREQKVDYVLASTYQISDGKIRITSQLYNVQSGLVEGSYKVELENSSIFSVQDAVAESIGSQLLKHLQREPNSSLARRYTSNEEAYRLYIHGTVLAAKRNHESLGKAVDLFEQAVRLDPNYALAYAGLANSHSALASISNGGESAEESLKAKAAIEKALAIDDNLAEGHSFSGEIKLNYEGDFAGAEREHKRAVELDPNSAAAHRMYALLLGFQGQADASITEIKSAIDLEPGSALNHHTYGYLLFLARRYDEAIVEAGRTVEMDPDYFFAYNVLTNSYRMKGDDDRAFEAFVQMIILSGDDPEAIKTWKAIYARSGWRGISGRQLEEAKAAEKNGDPNYTLLAYSSIELGQKEQAFAYLEQALIQRRYAMTTLKVNPRYDPLRSDPRFDDLLRRVGFR